MAKVTITNPAPSKSGRKIRGNGGAARSRCKVCGRAVRGNARLCRDCLSDSMGGGCGCGGGACTGGVCAPVELGKADGADAPDNPWRDL